MAKAPKWLITPARDDYFTMREVAKTVSVDGADIADYFALLKPRVMSLVVFTALAGMIAAPAKITIIEACLALLFIALGAGASGALNMWWDADIDSVMQRTRTRPIPRQAITAEAALHFGLWLAGFSVLMLALSANIAAAALLAFTIFFYVVIYTIWLKRRTPQNIVIGGAAGAFPPIIGWLSVAPSLSIEPLLMFLVIFLWTPPHFWSLALFVRSDYSDAKIPMLTVVRGERATRNQIFLYTLILAASSFWLSLSAIGGVLTFIVSVFLNSVFIFSAFQIWRRSNIAAENDDFSYEKRFFRQSLFYVFILFAALIMQAAINANYG